MPWWRKGRRVTQPEAALLKRKGWIFATVLAGGLLAGAAAGGVRALDQAARPSLADPDYLAWEICAGYVPRWLLPYMRNCVAEARAAIDGEAPSESAAGTAARFMTCGFP